MDIDKHKLSNDLTEAFIRYQWRLDNPMPKPSESIDEMFLHYHSDHIFNAKVNSLVAGIMFILDKHIT